jgi:hypothetical protein
VTKFVDRSDREPLLPPPSLRSNTSHTPGDIPPLVCVSVVSYYPFPAQPKSVRATAANLFAHHRPPLMSPEIMTTVDSSSPIKNMSWCTSDSQTLYYRTTLGSGSSGEVYEVVVCSFPPKGRYVTLKREVYSRGRYCAYPETRHWKI